MIDRALAPLTPQTLTFNWIIVPFTSFTHSNRRSRSRSSDSCDFGHSVDYQYDQNRTPAPYRELRDINQG